MSADGQEPLKEDPLSSENVGQPAVSENAPPTEQVEAATEAPAPTEEAPAETASTTEENQHDERQLDQDPSEAPLPQGELGAEEPRKSYDDFEDTGPPARPFDDEGRPLKIYIGNLSSVCKMFHLREKFSQYGTITNVELKTNIGCGFVQFTTAEAADAACRGMDGQELLDQKIRVEPQRAGGARGPKTDGAKSSDGCFNCGSRGHWSKHCPNPPTGNFRGRGRGRGRGGYHSYDNRHHHGGGYDAYPPRRQEYHDPYARDPYAAPPPRDPYGHAGRDPYYQDPYARDPYAAAPPPPRDPYARADPYARDPYARDSYPPPRPQADPYYRDAPPVGGPPRDYYEPRDDGRQQYRRGGTPPQDASFGRDVYAQPDPMRRRSRSPLRRGPPAQHDDYDYRYAPPQGGAADPYAAPDAYHSQGGPPAGGYADYDRTRGRSRSPQGGASGGGSYGYA